MFQSIPLRLASKAPGLRKDRIQGDGTTRNAAYYSILDDEWLAAKEKIEQQITAVVTKSK